MKTGNKIKFKSCIGLSDLHAIDIDDYKALREIYTLNIKDMGGVYSSDDWIIFNSHRSLIVPLSWMELVEQGHPHTKIFK